MPPADSGAGREASAPKRLSGSAFQPISYAP